ncbi:MAG TPA: M48 family metallopeptidase, partial [Rhodobacteraceae bacterium]|nr:M48 family metallopeptidase [Paracoccaceae bacterium]
AWSRLGENVLAHLVKSRKICTAPAGIAALNKLARKLAGDSAAAYSLHVAKLGVVNAFALPGRHVVISAKLIDKSRSADEVAGVLAHEIGHGLERHPETGLIRSLGISMAATVLFGGAGTEKIGAMAGFLLKMRYSREAERQADTHAINLLRAAAISTAPLADFFDRIAKRHKNGKLSGSFLNALRSHPATQKRITLLRAVRIKGAKPALTEADWQALRAICANDSSSSRNLEGLATRRR